MFGVSRYSSKDMRFGHARATNAPLQPDDFSKPQERVGVGRRDYHYYMAFITLAVRPDMNRKLIIVLYVFLLAHQVLCLRGALFRSGRSYRFRQPKQVEEDAPVDAKRSVMVYPMMSTEELIEKRPQWQTLFNRMQSHQ